MSKYVAALKVLAVLGDHRLVMSSGGPAFHRVFLFRPTLLSLKGARFLAALFSPQSSTAHNGWAHPVLLPVLQAQAWCRTGRNKQSNLVVGCGDGWVGACGPEHSPMPGTFGYQVGQPLLLRSVSTQDKVKDKSMM